VTSDGGTVYIAEYGRHRVRRATQCSPACTVVTVAGTGTPGSSGTLGGPATQARLNSPIAVTLDSDLLYIADLLNGRIVIVANVSLAPVPIPPVPIPPVPIPPVPIPPVPIPPVPIPPVPIPPLIP